tara:strand:+ start:4199 stop:4369 length:171 start_codon:yes stop_codon:yes gene_type:complete
LLGVIAQFVGDMREGHAKVKMSEVKKHLHATYFAWAGRTNDDAPSQAWYASMEVRR